MEINFSILVHYLEINDSSISDDKRILPVVSNHPYGYEVLIVAKYFSDNDISILFYSLHF